MAVVAEGSVLLTPKFDGLTASLNKQLGGLGKSSYSFGGKSGSQFSTGFALKLGVISSLANTAFSAVGSAISSNLGAAVSRVDTLNRFPKVMQQIGFSATDSSAAISKLSDGVKGLPTGLDEIAASAQSFALMTGDIDLATDTALALNDAFLAAGSSSADVSRGLQQYTQMLAKGKPDAQAWYTITETMGTSLSQVAKKLGYTSTAVGGDLYTALQNGTLSFDEFNAAMVECDQAAGGFHEQAKTASAGIATAFTNVGNAITRNMANAINAFSGDGNMIAKFAEDISSTIDRMGAAVEPVAAKMGEAFAKAEPKLMAFVNSSKGAAVGIGGAFAAVAPTVLGFATKVGSVFSGAFSTVASVVGRVAPTLSLMGTNLGQLVSKFGLLKGASVFFSGMVSPIGLAVAAVAALAAGIAYLWNTNEQFRSTMTALGSELMASLSPALTSIGATLGSFAATMLPMVSAAIAQIAPLIAQIITTLMQFAAAVLPPIVSLIAAILPLILQIATAVLPVIVSVIAALLPLITQVITVVASLVSAVLPIVTAAITVIIGVIQALLPIISGIITVVASVITAVIGFIVNVVTVVSGAITSIISFIGTVIGVVSGIVGTIAGIISSIASTISGGVSEFTSTVQNGVDSVINFVGGIPDAIMGFFSNAGSLLVDAGSSIVNGLLDGIKGAIGGVYDFVSGIAGKIQSLKGPLSYDRVLLTPAGKAIISGLQAGLEANIDGVYDFASGIAGNIANVIAAEPIAVEMTTTGMTTAAARAATASQDANAGGKVTNIYQNTKVVRADADMYSASTIINRNMLRLAGA